MDGKIAINGFGRIGRLTFRHVVEATKLELVAFNDIGPLDNLAYLLRHDSAQRDPEGTVAAAGQRLSWGNRSYRYLSVKDPTELPWKELDVKVVIEASGKFTSRDAAAKHLEAGAERVIVTAPAKGADLTVCLGVNDDRYDPSKHRVLSNATCTTNCLAPVAMVLDRRFGVETGFLSTVHAVTSSQSLVDGPAKKWRRGRSAMTSIIPTSTGATDATSLVLPELEGKMTGIAMRVPVVAGSIIELVARTRSKLTAEGVNDALREAAETDRLRGILGVSDEPLVSADIVGTTWSALVDAKSTAVLGGDTVRVLAWYDNEWAYARRVAELAAKIAGAA